MGEVSSETGSAKPISKKGEYGFCPVCGQQIEDAVSNAKETCPYDDCKASFYVRIY